MAGESVVVDAIFTSDPVLVSSQEMMEFTAIRETANLGARLESFAEASIPCISEAAYRLV